MRALRPPRRWWFLASLLVLLTACSTTTTESYDLGTIGSPDDGPPILRDGVASLLRSEQAGAPCWTIVTDRGQQSACAAGSGGLLEVDHGLAGDRATAVGGVVGKRVRKVEVTVDGVKRTAKRKDGFFLRLVEARGLSTVRALDGSGRVLDERTFASRP